MNILAISFQQIKECYGWLGSEQKQEKEWERRKREGQKHPLWVALSKWIVHRFEFEWKGIPGGQYFCVRISMGKKALFVLTIPSVLFEKGLTRSIMGQSVCKSLMESERKSQGSFGRALQSSLTDRFNLVVTSWVDMYSRTNCLRLSCGLGMVILKGRRTCRALRSFSWVILLDINVLLVCVGGVPGVGVGVEFYALTSFN